ncbi:hypothetical protein ACFSJU_11530 [Paradesertivirga mongoliensis]|uniref:Uncharacterized protein n=1 Tax=Paradesertivirga mongoliensis TaxID=2100740 RepID=A0ABW4ZM73_9SPHI|nr:hypothetical protein [Pedobacter mongoliensis]
MKDALTYLLPILLIVSCSSEKLDREKALKLLQENHQSQPATYKIFVSDPAYAKRMLDAGLESDGLLTVQRTQDFSDSGKPLISFTEKGEAYMVSQTEEDKKDNIQRVKIADQAIEEVTGIQMLDGDKKAVVEYTTSYRNVTPFAKLSKRKFDEKENHKADFLLYDDGWRVEQ